MLPNKTIEEEDSVTVEHNYRSIDHGPAHAHVVGGGETVTMARNGKPLASDPELTATGSPRQRGQVSNSKCV